MILSWVLAALPQECWTSGFLFLLWIKAHVHDKNGSSVNQLSLILLDILLNSIHSQWTNCTNNLTEAFWFAV